MTRNELSPSVYKPNFISYYFLIIIYMTNWTELGVSQLPLRRAKKGPDLLPKFNCRNWHMTHGEIQAPDRMHPTPVPATVPATPGIPTSESNLRRSRTASSPHLHRIHVSGHRTESTLPAHPVIKIQRFSPSPMDSFPPSIPSIHGNLVRAPHSSSTVKHLP